MKSLALLFPLFLLAACGRSTPIITSGSCSIDQPSANVTIPAAQNFNVAGWAFDMQSGVLPDHFRVQFTTTNREISKTFDVKHDVKRADVAHALNSPAAEASGFNLEIPANALAAGEYEIVILQELPNAILVCGNGHKILVK